MLLFSFLIQNFNSFFYRIVKIGFDDFVSTDQTSKSTSLKRKKLQSLRNHLTPANNVSNENIPKRLLSELASLSNNEFRIEIKSKFQSLVLPTTRKPSELTDSTSAKRKIDSNSENDVDFDSDYMPSAKNEIKTNEKSDSSSPLENDYVKLNCKIINRKLVLVPPIRMLVPYNYPDANPIVDCIQLEECDDDLLPGYGRHKLI